jgi:hypothetical protein
MRKKEKKPPTLTIINGWERKNFVIAQGTKPTKNFISTSLEDELDYKEVEFILKYKNPKTENVEFEILEWDFKRKEEVPVDLSSSFGTELCELKLIALKSCLTFLKTGALVL